MKTKQVIVMRTDTNPPMRKGKMIAQGSHASMAFLSKRVFNKDKEPQVPFFSEAELDWFNNSFIKVCVRVDSEKELLEIFEKAKSLGLESHLITDSAKTEFKEPTNTCVCIGPDLSEKIDQVTSHLRLL